MRTGPAVVAGWWPGWNIGPITWVWDRITEFGATVADGVFQVLISGITAWVLDGVGWVASSIAGFFLDATSPNVQTGWFTETGSPYAVMAAIAAVVMVAMIFAAVIQGVLAGEAGAMLRRLAVDVPLAVVGISAGVVVFQLLIDLSDAMAGGLMSQFGDQVTDFAAVLIGVSRLAGGTVTAIVVVILGLTTLAAGLVIFMELVIRSALIYLLVGMAPLAFAALVWPTTRGILHKTLELLVAVIFSKVVIALALSIGGAALAGANPFDDGAGNPAVEVPVEPGDELPAPAPDEDADADQNSVTAAVGALLAATAILGLACFSPFLVLRLLPMVEGAIVAQGVRGAPVRAYQQVQSVRSHASLSRRIAGGHGGPSPGPASSPTPGAGPGGGALAAAAGPVAAVAAAGAPAAAAARAATARPAATADPAPAPPPTAAPGTDGSVAAIGAAKAAASASSAAASTATAAATSATAAADDTAPAPRRGQGHFGP